MPSPPDLPIVEQIKRARRILADACPTHGTPLVQAPGARGPASLVCPRAACGQRIDTYTYNRARRDLKAAAAMLGEIDPDRVRSTVIVSAAGSAGDPFQDVDLERRRHLTTDTTWMLDATGEYRYCRGRAAGQERHARVQRVDGDRFQWAVMTRGPAGAKTLQWTDLADGSAATEDQAVLDACRAAGLGRPALAA